MLPTAVIITVLTFILVCLTSAENPIIQVTPLCPTKLSGLPGLLLTVDVPAYGLARCKNGDKALVTKDKVQHRLEGTFDQTYKGDNCVYYKKNGSNTFVVDVEVGWGEEHREVISHTEMHTISCAYDDHGNALTATEIITDGFLAPKEQQNLMGDRHNTSTFVLQVVDVFGRSASWSAIEIGRKIRLKAVDTSKTVQGFRALSCMVRNGITSYDILRAGCGDGLVFEKKTGFYSQSAEVLSPYFDAFKLRGSDTVQFECKFTICKSSCDGDSCSVETRRRRTLDSGIEKIEKGTTGQSVSLISLPIRTKVILEDTKKSPDVKAVDNVETDFLNHLGSLVRDYPPIPELRTPKVPSIAIFELIAFVSTLIGCVIVAFLVLYMCCKYRRTPLPSCPDKLKI